MLSCELQFFVAEQALETAADSQVGAAAANKRARENTVGIEKEYCCIQFSSGCGGSMSCSRGVGWFFIAATAPSRSSSRSSIHLLLTVLVQKDQTIVVSTGIKGLQIVWISV